MEIEMKNVSQLSIIFHDKIQNLLRESVKDEDVVEKKPSGSSSNNINYRMNRVLASWSSSPFQMPLDYPNYTKEEYEAMSEEDLDRLLKLYGLPVDLGDLSRKRKFAMGAFLWEKDQIDCSLDDLSCDELDESFFRGFLRYLVKSVCLV